VAPAPAAPPVGDAPKATIFVPAALVARALERRDVGATNATTPDGAQLGARLVGVSKYRTGLRDGDVVVSVAGTRTPTVRAMTTAALQAAGGVAPRISGRILRGDTTMTVVLELPR
jgi:S1-C subfamily serine protease